MAFLLPGKSSPLVFRLLHIQSFFASLLQPCKELTTTNMVITTWLGFVGLLLRRGWFFWGEGFCSDIQRSIHHTSRTVVLPLDCNNPGRGKKRGTDGGNYYANFHSRNFGPKKKGSRQCSSGTTGSIQPVGFKVQPVPIMSLPRVSQLFNTISFNESEDFI